MKPPAFLLFILCMLLSTPAFAQTYKLTVNVTGFRNDKGMFYITLYKGKDGYPKEYKKAFRISFSLIKNGKCTILFDHMPKGEYAIVCFHDENNNRNMDKNFLGIPKEGFGISNNAKGFLGAPKFKKAKFDISDNTTEEIKMRY